MGADLLRAPGPSAEFTKSMVIASSSRPRLARREELNDQQWEIIEQLIPQPPKRDDGKGRPRRDNRKEFNGIPRILPNE